MIKKFKSVIYTRPFIWLAYHIIKIYSLTFRVEIKGEKKWQKNLKEGKPILLCLWHQQFFSLVYHSRKYSIYSPGVIVSPSRDGDIIASIAERIGWHTIRGSSSRGGRKAMNALIDHLKRYGLGCLITDGPKGPAGKVKPGVIKIARETGSLIVPLSTSAQRAWFFNSWDRCMLPKPFSKIFVTFGKEISFDPYRNSREFEDQRKFLETKMLQKLILKKPGSGV